jgi:hypothetical protein
VCACGVTDSKRLKRLEKKLEKSEVIFFHRFEGDLQFVVCQVSRTTYVFFVFLLAEKSPIEKNYLDFNSPGIDF